MPTAVIWILFAAACALIMTAGVRAKRREREQREEQRPRRAA
jgi:hypothetical protein